MQHNNSIYNHQDGLLRSPWSTMANRGKIQVSLYRLTMLLCVVLDFITFSAKQKQQSHKPNTLHRILRIPQGLVDHY